MQKLVPLSLALLFLSGVLTAQASESTDNTLAQIQNLLGGSYDNRAQVEAVSGDVSEEEWQRLKLDQLLVPVQIEGFDGLTYFQQLSQDGTADTVRGVGIFHFYVDEDSDQVVMRLRSFKDREKFINAHLDKEKLAAVTMDELRWTEGCEMYFPVGAEGNDLRAEMGEKSCYPVNRETGEKLWHIDELIIKPDEIWSNGRFYDLDGNFLFGNDSGEHQKFVRYKR